MYDKDKTGLEFIEGFSLLAMALWVGGALFIWLTYAIYQQLVHQKNLPAALEHMQRTILEKGLSLLLLVVAMMFVNWGLEARKWQLLVSPLEKVPFMRAFSAILSGVTLSVNTPNRIGEYGGRILYLENRNKLKAIAATIVGSYSQLIITILFDWPDWSTISIISSRSRRTVILRRTSGRNYC